MTSPYAGVRVSSELTCIKVHVELRQFMDPLEDLQVSEDEPSPPRKVRRRHRRAARAISSPNALKGTSTEPRLSTNLQSNPVNNLQTRMDHEPSAQPPGQSLGHVPKDLHHRPNPASMRQQSSSESDLRAPRMGVFPTHRHAAAAVAQDTPHQTQSTEETTALVLERAARSFVWKPPRFGAGRNGPAAVAGSGTQSSVFRALDFDAN